MIFPFLLNKCEAIVGFIQFRDFVNWEAGTVWQGIGSHITSVDVAVLDQMGSKSCLAEVNRNNVIRGKPLKVHPEEPFHHPHEFNGDELGKKGLTFLFDHRIFRKIDKVVDIKTKGKWQGCCWYSRDQ
jgi:hypothetical protein